MATYLITHEVDDVDHWWNSTKRDEVFAPLGIAMRTFRDPEGSNRVGLLAEIPDLDAFNRFMQSQAATDAVAHDGVRLETLLVLADA